MRLEGKVALVTGSSRGIGRGIAIRLAHEGADVVVHYHHAGDGADEVLEQVRSAGRKAVSLQADVGSAKEASQLVERSIAQFGNLDILVNNAGVEKKGLIWDVTEEDFDLVLNVNLKGVFFATQAMVRYLRETRRPGKIINISSVHEDMAFPGFASYCASKGGLRLLARTLAVELRGLGITINNVAPGAIATPINTELLHDRPKLDALLQKIPLGRIGQPEDVAGVVAFLASADADYVTGSTYYVDGGLTVNYEEQ